MIALCAGMPRDDGWDAVAVDAAGAIEEVSKQCRFSAEQLDHRRGEYPALSTGVSFGGGQKVCPIISISHAVSTDTIVGSR